MVRILSCLLMLSCFLLAQTSTPPPASPPLSPPPTPQPKPPGSFDDSRANPAQPLRSVGVRGTIDAGGYAASATAKTQSELYFQLTDLQVSLLRSAWQPREACDAVEPQRRSALTKLRQGNYTGAVSDLEALLPVVPKAAAPHQLLGLAYEGTGQLEAAAEQFRIAAELQPDAASQYVHAVALLLLGDTERVISTSAKSADASARPATLYRLARSAALFQRGSVPESIRLLLQATSEDPATSEPFLFLAVVLRSAAPATLYGVIETLERVTRQNPRNGSAHYALACAWQALAAGASDQTSKSGIKAELLQAVAENPRLPDAHARLAACYAEQQKLPPAIAEYRKALELDPRLVELHYRLGQIYTRSGDLALAHRELELHRELRARQIADFENGRVPLRLPDLHARHVPACGENL